MAKARDLVQKFDKYMFPTHFGSHASMLFNEEGLIKLMQEVAKKEDVPKKKNEKKNEKKPVEEVATEGIVSLKLKVANAQKHLKEVEGQTDKVVLLDEHGTYITERKMLDAGVADPNRYTQSRVEYMCYEKEN